MEELLQDLFITQVILLIHSNQTELLFFVFLSIRVEKIPSQFDLEHGLILSESIVLIVIWVISDGIIKIELQLFIVIDEWLVGHLLLQLWLNAWILWVKWWIVRRSAYQIIQVISHIGLNLQKDADMLIWQEVEAVVQVVEIVYIGNRSLVNRKEKLRSLSQSWIRRSFTTLSSFFHIFLVGNFGKLNFLL